MVHQITKGIRISVKTKFEGTYFGDHGNQYAFSYDVLIENNSLDTIQLISRYWLIKDALNHLEEVSGPGVIGLQPILKPGERHQYSSGCLLRAPFGSMQGYYTMINGNNSFKIPIPLFKLSAPFAMN